MFTLADVLDQRVHAQSIFKIDQELVIGFSQQHEARNFVGGAPLLHRLQALGPAQFGQLLNGLFAHAPAGQRQDKIAHGDPGQKCKLVENAPVPRDSGGQALAL